MVKCRRFSCCNSSQTTAIIYSSIMHCYPGTLPSNLSYLNSQRSTSSGGPIDDESMRSNDGCSCSRRWVPGVAHRAILFFVHRAVCESFPGQCIVSPPTPLHLVGERGFKGGHGPCSLDPVGSTPRHLLVFCFSSLSISL